MAMRKKTLLKIILLGEAGVGKTSLMNQFVNRRWSAQYRITIGADFLVKEMVIGGDLCNLQIWDTAGAERFLGLGTAFYRGADAVAIVFDVTRPDSFEKVMKWRDDFLVHGNVEDGTNFPIVVLGNKVDLPNRMVPEKKASQFFASHNIPYFEVSARDMVNVDQAFHALAAKAVACQNDREYVPPPPSVLRPIKLDDKKPSSSELTCC